MQYITSLGLGWIISPVEGPAFALAYERLMTVNLVAFNKKGVRKDFPVSQDASIIGRTTEAQIQVPVQEVSRRHCQISIESGMVRMKDLGSSNGTFVNDHKQGEAILRAGDRLRVGPVTFVIQIDGSPKDINPAMLSGAATAPAAEQPMARAAPEAATRITPPKKDEPPSDDLDLDDLDVEDLSDFDLGDMSPMSPIEGGSEIEEIDELEELGEDDLIADDDEPPKGKK